MSIWYRVKDLEAARAFGVSPSELAFSSVIMSTAAAPSTMPDELPA